MLPRSEARIFALEGETGAEGINEGALAKEGGESSRTGWVALGPVSCGVCVGEVVLQGVLFVVEVREENGILCRRHSLKDGVETLNRLSENRIGRFLEDAAVVDNVIDGSVVRVETDNEGVASVYGSAYDQGAPVRVAV